MSFIKIKLRLENNFHLHLDNPTASTIEINADFASSINFVGWCFFEFSDTDCQVQVDDSDLMPLNVLRPDVAKAYNGSCLTVKSGFSITVGKQTEKIRFFHLGYCVGEISLKLIGEEDAGYIRYNELCTKFNNYLCGVDSDFDLELLNELTCGIDSYFKRYSEKFFCFKDENLDFARCEKQLNKHPVEMFDELFENISPTGLAMKSPIDGQIYTCKSSLYIAPFNYMRFQSVEGNVFFLVQHFSAADILFFPKQMIFMYLSSGIDSTKYNIEILKILFRIGCSFVDGPFNGCYLSHSRPYHFSYDLAPAVERLNQLDILGKIPHLMLNAGQAYYSFSKIYPDIKKETIFEGASFVDELNRDGFTSLLGIQFGHRASDKISVGLLESLDQKIIDMVSESDGVDNKSTPSKSEEITLWFGVTSQKRKWLNQVYELANLANSLMFLYDKVTVIVDGWTSPMIKNDGDFKEISNDEKVFTEIKKLLSPNIIVESVIGQNTFEKIRRAVKTDFFVANFGAGSLVIDRIAKKPGVTHFAKPLIGLDSHHLHYNSSYLGYEHVDNLEENSTKTADNTSYSTAKSSVAFALLEKIIAFRKNDIP